MHGGAIVPTARLLETGDTMEAKSSTPKKTGKNEARMLVLLAVCIVALVTILVVRPF
jgi:hypothetical protein